MKKIVALVLSLVMVLGLATTAMAATPAYVAEADDLATPYELATGVSLATHTFKLEKQVDEIAVTQTYAKYVVWATNKETKAPTQYGPFVLATSAESADFAFVDGTSITYLNSTATTWDKAYVVSKVATVDYGYAEKCGEIFTKGDYAVYADVAGAFYIEAAGGTAGYADGKMVSLWKANNVSYPTVAQLATYDYTQDGAGHLYIVSHEFKYDAKTVNGDETVTKVFCKACKAEFDFVQGVEAKAIAKFGAGNYYPNALVTEADQATVWVSLVPAGTATAPSVDGDKVESAETFDAGIAMYVGMSVMAAAGSAVVLKKKD